MNKISLNEIKTLFIPFEYRQWHKYMLWFWLFILGFSWMNFSGNHIPTPQHTWDAVKHLYQEEHLMFNISQSLVTCIKCLLIATISSLLIVYLQVTGLFSATIRKLTVFRFTSQIGMTLFVGGIINDGTSQKEFLLIWGISLFLLTSFSSMLRLSDEELIYPKVIGLSPLRTVWEVAFLSKLDLILDSVRQNFCIAWQLLAFVDTIVRGDGGMGVLLYDAYKHTNPNEILGLGIIMMGLGNFADSFLEFVIKIICPWKTIK